MQTEITLNGQVWQVTYEQVNNDVPPDPDNQPDPPPETGLQKLYYPPNTGKALDVIRFTKDSKTVSGDGYYGKPLLFSGDEIKFFIDLSKIPDNVTHYLWRLHLHTTGTPCANLGNWHKTENFFEYDWLNGNVIIITRQNMTYKNVLRDGYLMLSDAEPQTDPTLCYYSSGKLFIGFEK